jgi:hypothetical protein
MRVETTLLGRAAEVRYRIGAAGCGVNRIVLNDINLPFHDESNTYRRGAALVSLPTVLERLEDRGNILSIELG